MQQIARNASAESASDVLIGASRAFMAIAARSLARVEDLVTLPQYRALVVLASRGEMRPVDLADSLDVSPSTATRMCDRLVRKGLMERSHRASDRREVELRLSADGRALVNEVTARRRRDYQRILSRLGTPEQQQLLDSLRAFADAAGEHADGARLLDLAQ